MVKFVMTLLLGFLGVNSLAFSAAWNPPVFSELITEPKREIEISLENTSGQPDSVALQDLIAVLLGDPQYIGDVIHVKVGVASETLDLVNFMTPMIEQMGPKEELKASQWAKDVGQIIGGATGGVSGSAKIGVGVTHTETKSDGSSTSTTVKVDIEIKGGKK